MRVEYFNKLNSNKIISNQIWLDSPAIMLQILQRDLKELCPKNFKARKIFLLKRYSQIQNPRSVSKSEYQVCTFE